MAIETHLSPADLHVEPGGNQAKVDFKYDLLQALMDGATRQSELIKRIAKHPHVAEWLEPALAALQADESISHDGENGQIKVTPKGKYAICAYTLLTKGGILSNNGMNIGDGDIATRMLHANPATRQTLYGSIKFVKIKNLNLTYYIIANPDTLEKDMEEDDSGILEGLRKALTNLYNGFLRGQMPRKILNDTTSQIVP